MYWSGTNTTSHNLYMRLVKIISSGELRSVTNNDAHALIESRVAMLVPDPKLDTAGVHETGSTEHRQDSRINLRRRGKYIVK